VSGPVRLSRMMALTAALYVNGATLKQTAEILRIAPETAGSYLKRTRKALGVGGRFDLLEAMNAHGRWAWSKHALRGRS
jgi:DNA-binding CsgD family transcriptional regulator